jgi:hypothetical protein
MCGSTDFNVWYEIFVQEYGNKLCSFVVEEESAI